MADPFANSAFKTLPADAANLLRRVSAPPRLIAHLILVHDVASRLVDNFARAFPDVTLDKDAVLFGAATHDFGKVLHNTELVQPGKEHERCGVELLLDMGVPPNRARFAYTHGNWDADRDVALEDLLVALADNCWKGKRLDPLESKTVEVLSSISGNAAWDCYARLDEILGALTVDADARLEWQRQFGTEAGSKAALDI